MRLIPFTFISWVGHCSYVDSGRLWLSSRWTSRAQPRSRFNSSTNSILSVFVVKSVRRPPCEAHNHIPGRPDRVGLAWELFLFLDPGTDVKLICRFYRILRSTI